MPQIRTTGIEHFAHQKDQPSFFKMFVTIIQNLRERRELILILFKKDFIYTYRRSFFGMAWLFLSPLFTVVSWLFMNAAGLLKPGQMSVPYPVYVLMGITIWNFFANCVTLLSGSLESGAGFINQVYFPHEILFVKQALLATANFFISLIFNTGIIIAIGYWPSVGLFLIPILVLPIAILGCAIGLILSVAYVVIPDLRKITEVILGILLVVTPVFYSADSKVGWLSPIIRLNPLSALIEFPRDVVLLGGYTNIATFSSLALLSITFFLAAVRFFFLFEHDVIEKMM